jgi:polysaccharide export outer membrane protein
MPNQGPTVREINDNPNRGKDFAVVKLTPAVLQKIRDVGGPSLHTTFGDMKPAPVRTITKGDTVSVTIWEPSGGGVTSAEPSQGGVPTSAQPTVQMTTVPPQTVDPQGEITVPFVGQIYVAGRSTVEVQSEIVRRLEGQAVKPQVLVTILTDLSNLVSIVGDVKKPDQYPLNVNGTRVLDAIAKAGGSVAPAFDTIVQLNRRGVQRRVRLSQVVANPQENIYLEPDDTVYLLHDPEFISVLGATKNNMRVEFDSERLTLAEVIGQSGGLVDLQAEPTGVYVMRLEPAELVSTLTKRKMPPNQNGMMVPVLFQDNMREPPGFFLAQSFDMNNKDIVFVADTESVQLNKVLQLVLQAAAIVGIVRGGSGSLSVP